MNERKRKTMAELLSATPVDAINMSEEHVDETAKGEQEPVAWIVESKHGNWAPYIEWSEPSYLETQVVTPLYTVPPKPEYATEVVAVNENGIRTVKQTTIPQKEWVGLTHAEIREIYKAGWSNNMDFAQAIEAKLKEKNT